MVENTLGVLHNITKNLENIRKHLKKRAGNPHFRACAEHTSVTDVIFGHVTSGPMTSLPNRFNLFYIFLEILQLLSQTATFEKYNVTCFPHGWLYKNISFSRNFSNRNVWNATLLVFRVSFSRIFSKHNVWNATLLVFRVSFTRTFSKISHLSQTATFENTTLLLISLKCLHYRYNTF